MKKKRRGREDDNIFLFNKYGYNFAAQTPISLPNHGLVCLQASCDIFLGEIAEV